MTKNHIERCSTSLLIMKMQLKTKMKYYFKLIRLANFKRLMLEVLATEVKKWQLTCCKWNYKWV